VREGRRGRREPGDDDDMRIGEVLVGKGLISTEQLGEALDAQTIYGGHLGTCLIELGHVDERALGEALGQAFGVKHAAIELFQNIPRYVVQALPQKLAVKYSAVPLRLEDKTLAVAMIDPKDLAATDEIGFVTGYRIDPWVAPEVRVYQAMERYYDVPRKLRYVTICRQLDKQQDDLVLETTGGFAANGNGGDDQPLGVSGAATAVAQRAPATVHERPNPEAASPLPATGIAVGEASTNPEEMLRDASRLMTVAQSREALVKIVQDCMSGRVKRSAIFAIKAGDAVVLRAAGAGVDSHALRGVKFPLTTEPMFGLLLGKPHFRGAVPDEPQYRAFYAAMQMEFPSEVLQVPVYVKDHLVAVLYADGGPSGRIRGRIEDFVRLMKKLSLALQMVQFKQKIEAA